MAVTGVEDVDASAVVASHVDYVDKMADVLALAALPHDVHTAEDPDVFTFHRGSSCQT